MQESVKHNDVVMVDNATLIESIYKVRLNKHGVSLFVPSAKININKPYATVINKPGRGICHFTLVSRPGNFGKYTSPDMEYTQL